MTKLVLTPDLNSNVNGCVANDSGALCDTIGRIPSRQPAELSRPLKYAFALSEGVDFAYQVAGGFSPWKERLRISFHSLPI